ncbi:GNAT family N-acetyltransferase [Longispora sp. NPDC051575]|uniref:GNAT family N-acetyltransferase n=1 Tax=Longispora sp. NPDC051575 TaxID=3154943 RepID=UPI00342F506B
MIITEDLVRRWLRGWGLARRLPAPEPVDGGLQVRCDQPGRQVEVFALRADEEPDSVARLAARVAAADLRTWLTVTTTRPEEVGTALAAGGLELLDRPEWLMSVDLTTHPRHAPADTYRSTVEVDGPVVTVSIHDPSGVLAARGQLAVSGTDAVADRIETSPEHRRRGLASAVMGALAGAAVDQGARTGLLIASADGQHLYSRLGWRREADVLIARPA